MKKFIDLNGLTSKFDMFRIEATKSDLYIISNKTNETAMRVCQFESVNKINHTLSTFGFSESYTPYIVKELNDIIMICDEEGVDLIRTKGCWLVIRGNGMPEGLNEFLHPLGYEKCSKII